MKILVCISHVPDTTSKIEFDEEGKALRKEGLQFIIGPYDDYALSKAVDLAGEHQGEVEVLTVGGVETEASLKKALAIGADKAVRIDQEPTDSFVVASLIAAYAKGKDFDLILMGRESIDFNGGVVHGMVGELLGMSTLVPVMALQVEGGSGKVTLDRETDSGKETLETSLPLVLGCQEPIAEWKIPNMRGIMSAKRKPLEVVSPETAPEVSLDLVRYTLPAKKSEVTMIDADAMGELVSLLRNEAKVL